MGPFCAALPTRSATKRGEITTATQFEAHLILSVIRPIETTAEILFAAPRITSATKLGEITAATPYAAQLTLLETATIATTTGIRLDARPTTSETLRAGSAR